MEDKRSYISKGNFSLCTAAMPLSVRLVKSMSAKYRSCRCCSLCAGLPYTGSISFDNHHF